MKYAELGITSSFSFLEGASSPEELVNRAAQLDLSVLALTDLNGIYGIPRFHNAAQKAGLHNVPVIIKDLNDKEILEIALIENMQREDLNPIEEAMGMSRLQKDHNYTQEKLSEILGKSRPQIANILRLLNLPHKVQEFVQNKTLSAGHARALVGLDNAFSIAKYAIKKGMNVRQLENYITYVKKQKGTKKEVKNLRDPNILLLEKDLNNILGLIIKISHNKSEKGNIKIFYDNLDQLNNLIKKLKK